MLPERRALLNAWFSASERANGDIPLVVTSKHIPQAQVLEVKRGLLRIHNLLYPIIKHRLNRTRRDTGLTAVVQPPRLSSRPPPRHPSGRFLRGEVFG